MTFEIYETSVASGSPVELYEFQSEFDYWRYATTESPINKGGEVFEPSSIKRSKIKQTSDTFRDNLKVTLPFGDAFTEKFVTNLLEKVVTLTLYKGHLEDPDEEWNVYWKGRVVGISASNNELNLECESVYTSIRRSALQPKFSKTCRHALFDLGCTLPREFYKVTRTVDVVSGSGVSITLDDLSGFADDYFTGGMVRSADGIYRFVQAHSGNTIILAWDVTVFTVGSSADLFPGCDHLHSTCVNKFSNGINFGGCPYLPKDNPFNGNSVA